MNEKVVKALLILLLLLSLPVLLNCNESQGEDLERMIEEDNAKATAWVSPEEATPIPAPTATPSQ